MKIKSILLQLPLWILIFASFLGGIYAAINKISGITFTTPIIILVIITMYIIGRVIDE